VEAVDTVQEMLDLTRERAAIARVDDRLTTRRGDANELSYTDGAFDLVLAIGVLPWVRDNASALREFARVLRPGGHLIVNIDNKWALHRLIDPQLNPIVRPVKKALRSLLNRFGLLVPEAREQLCANSKFDQSLARFG